MTEFTQVATIPKTAQQCKAEGIGLWNCCVSSPRRTSSPSKSPF